MISPFVVYPVVTNAFQQAGRAFLLSQGRIGEAAFADLVGLPRWFEVGKVVGGLAAVVVVEGIIDAIDGAVNRDNLRDAIHDAVKARQEFEKSYLVNYRLSISIQAMIKVLHALRDNNTETPLIIEKIKEMVKNAKEEINTLTDESVESVLAGLDLGRGKISR